MLRDELDLVGWQAEAATVGGPPSGGASEESEVGQCGTWSRGRFDPARLPLTVALGRVW